MRTSDLAAVQICWHAQLESRRRAQPTCRHAAARDRGGGDAQRARRGLAPPQRPTAGAGHQRVGHPSCLHRAVDRPAPLNP
eukprot:CAMPEP_0179846656 /NCGR_PEP_ID=MMETSP0982-20121206/5666_1 /TAXON_ID=483367 /ORGANISM="non described non described, Strain CCMP 2436" /LENGTH=80 /DNA_ID=CAMNT_0021731789 /DNA_START=88 /DNA_END=327 /DNA_ORIENTATION=+